MTRTHTRHNARDAAELRQYTQLLQAVKKAARAYQRHTGSRINWTYTTLEDIAAAAYIIAQDEPTRPGDSPGDKLRRVAYEAVRRAARAQQRHAHQDMPEEAAGPDTAESAAQLAALLQSVHKAGPVAVLLSQGLTPADISRRLALSRTTAWREVERARERVRAAIGA